MTRDEFLAAPSGAILADEFVHITDTGQWLRGDGHNPSAGGATAELMPAGYGRLVSTKATDITLKLVHDGTDGAAGFNVSVNGGVPTFSAQPLGNVITSITIPAADGRIKDCVFWPAANATSGRAGNISQLTASGQSITYAYVRSIGSALWRLNLRNNELPNLDVGALTSLIELDLINNKISELEISALASLEILSLDGNEFTTLDLSAFTHLSLSLGLSNNPLTRLTLPPGQIDYFYGFQSAVPTLLSVRGPGFAGAYTYKTVDFSSQLLSAEAINQFFTDLAAGTCTIDVSDNPGSATCDPTIATAKGYTVLTA